MIQFFQWFLYSLNLNTGAWKINNMYKYMFVRSMAILNL